MFTKFIAALSLSLVCATAARSGEIMSTGPKGEKAASATELALTDAEIAKIREGNYTAAICFHYSGDDWSRAQQEGLRDAFKKFGIEVLAVTDANFKVEQQVSDIESVLALDPDILISIPVDPVSTAPAFKKAAAAGVKIVFMDNCPADMEQGREYVSIVSADNYGNGVVAADLMAEALGGKGNIGVIYHDAKFFVTNQRVEAFEKTITEKYPDIRIIDRGGFDDPNKVSDIADAMFVRSPELNGIFANWDIPAEAVVSSAIAMGRDDIVVTTIDYENAPYSNLVIGEAVHRQGRWAGYIPHHHPQPEVYYFRFDRPQGFGASFIGDEAHKITDGSFAAIPGGLSHPQVTAPGYRMYFCWMIRHLDGNPWTDRIDVEEHKWLLDAKF